MSLIRKHTNLLFVFILPVYLYIVQNSIQNKHTHVYANGIVITHSHPNESGDVPLNNHEHSQREICLFASLHFDLYETPTFAGFNFEIPESHMHYYVSNQKIEAISVPLNTKPRAPPV